MSLNPHPLVLASQAELRRANLLAWAERQQLRAQHRGEVATRLRWSEVTMMAVVAALALGALWL